MPHPLCLIFTLLLGIYTSCFALPLKQEQIPEPLKPWAEWVLHDNLHDCPFVYNNEQQRQCAWPSRLKLELGNQQGRFSSHWTVYRRSEIQLPGDERYWPQSVTLNAEPAVVAERDGRPVIRVEAGDYRIEGQLIWSHFPERLSLPAATGLVQLSVLGNPVSQPRIKKGELWLKHQQPRQTTEQDRLKLQVFRRISDSVPMRIETRLNLEISGKQRELLLESPLLGQAIPLRLDSPLPARLEPDGRLLVQVRPGRYTISLAARLMTQTEVLTMPERRNWPENELWVFDARPDIRLVEVLGQPSIDASRTQLPSDWRQFPTYRLAAGESLQLKTYRRGDDELRPNKLNLQRTLWLDFAGQGYTIQDQITGTLSQGSRLDAQADLKLGQILLNGQPQLITHTPEAERIGVELRRGAFELVADSRYEGEPGHLSAVGWLQGFRSVSSTLHMPPGWSLFAARGMDNLPDTWINRWSLWDLFFVLMISIAFARLWQWPQGVLACVTLLLTWHVHGAPKLVWVSILVIVALLRVLPSGRFYQFIRMAQNALFLSLVLILLPFAVEQVRQGLYPQLSQPRHMTSYGQILNTTNGMGALMELAAEETDSSTQSYAARSMPAMKTRRDSSLKPSQLDPKANIQTGPGLPRWNWRKVHFSWNGPVAEDARIGLYFINPSINACLNVLRVILVALLGWQVILLSRKMGNPAQSKATAAQTSTVIMFLAFSGLGAIPDAQAELPNQALLTELKQRLLPAPECLPQCAQFASMYIKAQSQRISLELEIHVQDSVAFPLPIPDQWQPDRISLNGQSAGILRRLDNRLWIHLQPGRHQVSLTGVIEGLQSLSLPLPVKPHRVEVEAVGWQIDGVRADGRIDEQLYLSRVAEAGSDAAKTIESGELPGFVQVKRTVQMGLDWSVRTEVTRSSQTGFPLLLSIPLLKGEKIISGGVQARQGQVLVNLLPRQNQISWTSSLDKTDELVLIAAKTDAYHEHWLLDASPIWHVATDGIPVIYKAEDNAGWLSEWFPWPGEQVRLRISKPAGVEGRTLTVEQSRLQIQLREHVTDTTLHLQLRSSKGEQHPIQLPESAELQFVRVDGQIQPIKQQDRKLMLPVQPGNHQIEVNWQQATDSFLHWQSAELDLGLSSVNHSIQVTPEHNRWLVFLRGPQLGPAVLIWGVLLVVAGLSYGLGRGGWVPLNGWQWFLLLLGLTQTPLPMMVLVIAWLMALSVRGKQGAEKLHKRWQFNLAQLGLVALTVLALASLMFGVHHGLLGQPEMQVAGNGSSAYHLNWYQDRLGNVPPQVTIYSLPMVVYKLLMLGWALWMAFKVLDLLKWGWSCFADGGVWKRRADKILADQAEADSAD